MERQSVLLRAEQAILEIIQQGDYKAGDKLPTEAQLVQQIGAGRNTVREALRILASRNIVEVRQGAGCFLSDKQGVAQDPLGFSLVDDRRRLAQELLDVRILIEPEIAALAAQNATPEDIAALEELLAQLEQLVAHGDDFSENDAQFHAQVACCTHNQVVSRLMPIITDGVFAFKEEISTREYHYTLKNHRELVRAIAANRAIEAKQIMTYHLLYNKQRWAEEDAVD